LLLDQLNTAQLISKCRKRNKSAQLEIYNRYYKTMYNTSFRIVKDSQEAEDIMQESFLKAFTKLASLQDDELFGAWLKKIVINMSLSAAKKNSAFKEIDLETITLEKEAIIVDDTTDQMTLTKSNIMKSLLLLKDNYSTILSLHYIEGYDYEEICQVMNISYSNCRTLISRAKESLRKKIELI